MDCETEINQNEMVGSPMSEQGSLLHQKQTKTKRFRSSFTTKQLHTLETEYKKKPYVQRTRKAELSMELNLSERQIKTWFQNKRMNTKQTKKNVSNTSTLSSPKSVDTSLSLEENRSTSKKHSKIQSEVSSEGKLEITFEVKSEITSEVKSEITSEVKSEVTSEVKSEITSDVKSVEDNVSLPPCGYEMKSYNPSYPLPAYRYDMQPYNQYTLPAYQYDIKPFYYSYQSYNENFNFNCNPMPLLGNTFINNAHVGPNFIYPGLTQNSKNGSNNF